MAEPDNTGPGQNDQNSSGSGEDPTKKPPEGAPDDGGESSGEPGGGESAGGGAAPDGSGTGGTGAGGTGAGEGGAGEGSKFEFVPQDWREQMASGDEKRLQQLQRYNTFEDWVNSTWEARNRIAQGFQPLPDNPTEEQLAEYRRSLGIPETLDEYQPKFSSDDIQIEDGDRPYIDAAREVAHKWNIPPEALGEMTEAWLSTRDQSIEYMERMDQLAIQDASKALKEHWGPDATVNQNVLSVALAGMDEETKNRIMGGRAADGTPLAGDVEFINWIVQKEREANPYATVITGGEGDANTAQTRKEEIESWMNADDEETRNKYFKDPKVQDEYRRLIAAEQKAAGTYREYGETG